MLRPWEYFLRAVTLGSKRQAGRIPAFVALAMALVIISKPASLKIPGVDWLISSGNAWITVGVAALLFFVVGQYDAWSEERIRRELAEAKNQAPEIRGEYHLIRQTMRGDGMDYVIQLHLVNHSIAGTTIRAVLVSVRNIWEDLPVNPKFQEVEADLDPPGHAVTLERGIGKVIVARASTAIPLAAKNGLSVNVIDAFGNRHLIAPLRAVS